MSGTERADRMMKRLPTAFRQDRDPRYAVYLAPLWYVIWTDEGTTTYQVLATAAGEMDTLQETLARVVDAHHILRATGASLDAIGALFSCSRELFETDDDYRSRILGAQAQRLSCGTVQDIKTIVSRVTGCPAEQVEILERQAGDPDASFRIRLAGENTLPFSLAILEDQVNRGKAAGVAFNINQTTIVLTPLDLALGTRPGTIMVINTGSRGGWGLSPWGTYPYGGKYLTLATGPAIVTPFEQ